MLKARNKRFLVMAAGSACALTLGAAVAFAATDDTWASGANSAWSGGLTTGVKAVFKASFATISCTTSSVGGSSTGAAPDAGQLTSNQPTFTGCTDQNNTAVTISVHGTWQVGFYSDSQPSVCSTSTDETSGSDCLDITIPQGGVTFTELGCSITISPNGPTDIAASVSDPGGTTPDTATITNASIPYSASGFLCSNGTGTENVEYTLSSPNSGVLVDNS